MFLRSLNYNIEPELVSTLVFTDVQRSIFLFYCPVRLVELWPKLAENTVLAEFL